MHKSKGDALSDFFNAQKWKLNKCLEPLHRCKNQAIRAHSIQNSRTLNLIQQDGKVWMMAARVGANGPQVDLDLIGRNQASTFTGLCSYHDASIFKPIDTQEIDPANAEQLFLLAYRAVTREYHVIMEGAVRIQSVFRRAVEKGQASADKTSPEMLVATEGLVRTYGFYRYRASNFDISYLKRDFSTIVHDALLWDQQEPTIAASAFYSIKPIINAPFTGIIVNVIPLPEKRMLVVFSYTEEDCVAARSSLDSFFNSVGHTQKYELSKLLLAHTENFVLSPDFVGMWSQSKRNAIVQAFRKTINAPPDIGESPDYMLF